MKTVTPRFVKAHRIACGSMAASYQARCPFCRKSNLAWPSEMNAETREGTNRCRHFECVRAGRFVFRKAPSIRVSAHGVKINGVYFDAILGTVFCLFDEIQEESDTFHDARLKRLGVFSYSYAYGARTNEKWGVIHAALGKRLGMSI